MDARVTDQASDPKSSIWLGTIVFTDIVEYSVHTVDHQIEIKEHFNRLVAQAVEGIDPAERVLVDAGDGLALCFLGDPETAVVSTLSLRRQLAAATPTAPVPYMVRTGINLGPVRLVTDINGQYNVLGDGINVAQRVMSFAGPNQVLVARSFYDVAWCLSERYSTVFRYYGMRKDKHDRQHALYELSDGDAVSRPTGSDRTSQEPSLDTFTRNLRERLASDSGPLTNMDWDSDKLRQVENCMLEYVGPLAKVLVRKSAARTSSEEDLYVELARAIPAGDDRVAFLEQASNVLDEETRTMLLEQPPGMAAAPVKGRNWPTEVIDIATRSLAPHVGPIAGILVRKASRRSTTLAEMYQRLSVEIADPKAREDFLRQIAD